MKQLSRDDLQFLARFARLPDGARLLTMLRAKLADRDGELRKAQGEDVYRAQGRAQELDELIDLIEKAEQTLNRNTAPLRRTPVIAP